MASSRVGNNTSALTFFDGDCRSISRIGIRNARVLPVPVWAVPITSLPSRAGEMARAWMGVRVMNCAAASFCCKAADKGSSVNVVIRLFSFWRGLLSISRTQVRVRMPLYLKLALEPNGGQEMAEVYRIQQDPRVTSKP